MNLEDTIREAIVAELERQSDAGEGVLKITVDGPVTVRINGPVNLDELAMVIAGSLAGGP
jgi:hypothetical protein